jgi:hypothetical protein
MYHRRSCSLSERGRSHSGRSHHGKGALGNFLQWSATLTGIIGAVLRSETDTRKPKASDDLGHPFFATRAIHMATPVRSQGLIQPVRNPRLFERVLNALSTLLVSPKDNQSGWEVAAGALKIGTHPVLSLRSPSDAHKMRTITLTQVAIHSIRLPIETFRRNARRLAVRLVHYVRFYAERYSAAVQYEDLANLSAAELERLGIAPGDLHRQVADALPKWPSAK